MSSTSVAQTRINVGDVQQVPSSVARAAPSALATPQRSVAIAATPQRRQSQGHHSHVAGLRLQRPISPQGQRLLSSITSEPRTPDLRLGPGRLRPRPRPSRPSSAGALLQRESREQVASERVAVAAGPRGFSSAEPGPEWNPPSLPSADATGRHRRPWSAMPALEVSNTDLTSSEDPVEHNIANFAAGIAARRRPAQRSADNDDFALGIITDEVPTARPSRSGHDWNADTDEATPRRAGRSMPAEQRLAVLESSEHQEGLLSEPEPLSRSQDGYVAPEAPRAMRSSHSWSDYLLPEPETPANSQNEQPSRDLVITARHVHGSRQNFQDIITSEEISASANPHIPGSDTSPSSQGPEEAGSSTPLPPEPRPKRAPIPPPLVLPTQRLEGVSNPLPSMPSVDDHEQDEEDDDDDEGSGRNSLGGALHANVSLVIGEQPQARVQPEVLPQEHTQAQYGSSILPLLSCLDDFAHDIVEQALMQTQSAEQSQGHTEETQASIPASIQASSQDDEEDPEILRLLSRLRDA